MSDYTIILGYGVALLAGLLAIAKREKTDDENRPTITPGCAVEVRG